MEMIETTVLVQPNKRLTSPKAITNKNNNRRNSNNNNNNKNNKNTTKNHKKKMPSDCKVTLHDHEINEFSDHLPKKGDIEVVCGKPKGAIGQFRETLCEVLHHHYFQIIICVLVLLDTAVVVTEIMVDSSNNRAEKSHHLETAELVLHYVSLSILSIFMFEITIKIFAMGAKILKYKFEIFDAVIVTISFFLDIFLSSGGLKDGVEFLVLLRLWRITRIINGIVISVKTQAEEKVKNAQYKVEVLEETNGELLLRIETQEREIERLNNLLSNAGCSM